MKKSVYPDQLASLEEAHCFEPTMFLKMGYRAFKNQYMYCFFFTQYTVTLCGKSIFHTIKNCFKGKNLLPVGANSFL